MTVLRSKLEDLDESMIPNNSLDGALSRCANCSLSDMQTSFKIINRLLKKGGRFYFWDHVLAEDNIPMMLVQYAMSLPVISFFTDCCLTRQPWKETKKAGFTDVKVRQFKAPLEDWTAWPCIPTACGHAEK